jgi:hypothetical protein
MPSRGSGSADARSGDVAVKRIIGYMKFVWRLIRHGGKARP